MSDDNIFLLSNLPGLWSIDDPPPVTLAELCSKCFGSTRKVVQALALGDDLVQRDAVLSGETKDIEPSVLTAAQISGDEPLPSYLIPSEDTLVPSDGIWAAWFRYLADLPSKCEFIDAYVAFEVGLRNALVRARARALELDPAEYLVAPELGEEHGFDAIVAEWSQAPNPLMGQRILDQARWQFVAANDAWFSFSDNELAAYTVRLILMQRWHRLAKAERAVDAEQNLVRRDEP